MEYWKNLEAFDSEGYKYMSDNIKHMSCMRDTINSAPGSNGVLTLTFFLI